MSTILYLETNFIIGAAFGQDKKADALLQTPYADLEIALPSICIMEAWAVFDKEKEQRDTFKNILNDQIARLKRHPDSSHAVALIRHLQAASIENAKLLNDVEDRLRNILSKLSGLQSDFPAITLLPLTQAALQNSLPGGPTKDHTDNLILAVILDHAQQHSSDTKVLMSGNTKDFQTPEVNALLSTAGMTRYFSRTEDFLGWFHAEQPKRS